MEDVVKKYLQKLVIASLITAALIVLFLGFIAGAIAVVVLPALSYAYVRAKENDPKFIENLKSPHYGKQKKRAGIMVASAIACAIMGFVTYLYLPVYAGAPFTLKNYIMIAITVILAAVFVYFLLKKE